MRSVSAAAPSLTVVGCRNSSEIYKTRLCPQLFYVSFRYACEYDKGRSYEVIVSKFSSRDGKLYRIASRLKDLSTGKITQFRDSSCMLQRKGRRLKRGMN